MACKETEQTDVASGLQDLMKESNAEVEQARSEIAKQATTPVSEQIAKQRRSPLRSSQNACAGFITIFGNTYFYREMSSQLGEWLYEQMEALAHELGITVDALEKEDLTGANPDKAAELPVRMDEICTQFLTLEKPRPVLVQWDVEDDEGHEVPLTPEYVADCALEVKAAICARIRKISPKGGNLHSFRHSSA